MDILDLSLSDTAKALKRKDLSSSELTRFFLERIERHNSRINGYIHVDADAALATAAHADKMIKSGKFNHLTGIPYAHKDIFCTQGVKTTCASKMLRNFVPPYDATVSAKLKHDGMVMLGKTNMDEFARGSSTETGDFGVTVNPWQWRDGHNGYVAGGSSGGSAAVVAAGLAPCATATDTGGSIRQPAAFCNLTGIKPTYGCVSRHGMIAFASSLDQGGVIAHSAEDCAHLLQVIAGYDAKDPTAIQRETPDYTAELGQLKLSGKRIGLIVYPDDADNEAATRRLDEVTAFYAAEGCEVTPVELPSLAWGIPSYYVIAMAECSSNLSRYDGVRYGHRCDQPKDLNDLYCRSRGEGFGAEVKRRIMVGTHVLSAGYYDAYYLKAQKIRRRIADDFAAALEKNDVLLAPTTPTPAFKIGEKADDPANMYLSDQYTVPANLAGLPAVSVPAGFDDGLPFGFQLMGRHFDEARLLAFAHAWQMHGDKHKQRPEGFE